MLLIDAVISNKMQSYTKIVGYETYANVGGEGGVISVVIGGKDKAAVTNKWKTCERENIQLLLNF